MRALNVVRAPDVLVVGGGSAGLFAAIAAGQSGARTVLVEKGERLGKKLLISGGGRCNVTNSGDLQQLIEHTPGNGRFLHSVYAQWSNRDIVRFFEVRGVLLKEEDHGRLFPASNSANTVLQALVNELQRLGVEIRYRHAALAFLIEHGRVCGLRSVKGDIQAGAVVIATGGVTAQATGSSGDGYALAESVGHKIVAPYPTSVPLTSPDVRIVSRTLQGIAVQRVHVKLLSGKKILASEEGDLLFTHFGLSGPVALRLSQYLVREKTRNPAAGFVALVDFVPAKTVTEWLRELQEYVAVYPGRSIKQALKPHVPERLAEALAEEAGLAVKRCHEVSRAEWERLVAMIKRWPLAIGGTLGMEKAFITGGGVDLRGIDPRTLASKLAKGLYFAGEVIDIHGHTGGYNLTAAFATGYVAGGSAAKYALARED